jgi:hypothetical protein
MEHLQRLLAQGIDYYDALGSVEACMLSDHAIRFDTSVIAMHSITEDDILKECKGPMRMADNIRVMMMSHNDDQLNYLN